MIYAHRLYDEGSGEERRGEERRGKMGSSVISRRLRENTIYMHDASLCMMGRCFLFFFYNEGFVVVMVAKAQQSKTVMGNVVLQCNKNERDHRDMKRAMTQRDKKRWWRKRMQVDISGFGNNKYYRRVALGFVPIH